MKKILLGRHDRKRKKYYALVDDEDFEWLNLFKWHMNTSGYAQHTFKNKEGSSHSVSMHRLINSTPKELQTDHINHDRLDNRKKNLRTVTPIENSHNLKSPGCITKIHSERWRATIVRYYKKNHLGYFKTKEDARYAINSFLAR